MQALQAALDREGLTASIRNEQGGGTSTRTASRVVMLAAVAFAVIVAVALILSAVERQDTRARLRNAGVAPLAERTAEAIAAAGLAVSGIAAAAIVLIGCSQSPPVETGR